MNGTAWGMSTAVQEETWEHRALCRMRGVDPDLWGGESAQGNRQAAHLCNQHCPVRAECAADSLRRGGDVGVVRAGTLWNRTKAAPCGHQPQVIACGPFCQFARQAQRAAVAGRDDRA